MDNKTNNTRPSWAWRNVPIPLVGGDGDETVFSHLFGACMSLNKCSHDGTYSGGLLKFLLPDDIANLGLVCKEANEVVNGLKSWNNLKVITKDELKECYKLDKRITEIRNTSKDNNKSFFRGDYITAEYEDLTNQIKSIRKNKVLIDINHAENNKKYKSYLIMIDKLEKIKSVDETPIGLNYLSRNCFPYSFFY